MRAILILTLLLAAVAGGVHPQNCPSHTVTIINPYTAGSSTDVMARALARQFEVTFGQPFVIMSRDGGSGVVGMTALAQAAPDGYTLAYTPPTALTVQPHLVPGTRPGPAAPCSRFAA